ncbi:MAG: hypothetical protein ACREBS_07335 [Nitrososphaerales archaeon]
MRTQEQVAANQLAGERLDAVYFFSILAVGIIAFALYSVSQNVVREERARHQSLLLQDILTHDIRNCNQVAKMSAELPDERLRGDEKFQDVASTLLQSIDGSTQLVAKAQKLGRILSEGKPKLHSVDLIYSIDRSLLLVRKAYAAKEIKETRHILKHGDNRRSWCSQTICLMKHL